MCTPFFSIVIPVYNVEKYLNECVDSVLIQTFTDFEVILVDDGSPDKCPVICDEYAETDSRIHVIHKKNGGLSDARNAGLDIARGKYIYFLDGDDTIEPDLLETVVPYMEQGYDMVAFTLRSFYDDGRVTPPWKRETGIYTLQTSEARRDFFFKTLVQAKIGWEACLRVFVRDKIEQYNLRFVDNRKIFAEDLFFSLCYCAHAEKIISIDACLYNYRQRENSIMHEETGRNNLERINKLADAVLEYYSKFEDCKGLVDDFSFLRFQIFMSQFIFLSKYAQSLSEFRKSVITGVSDWPKIEKLLHDQMAKRKKWKKYYSPVSYYELISNVEFLLDGHEKKVSHANWIVRKIKNLQERIDMIGAVYK